MTPVVTRPGVSDHPARPFSGLHGQHQPLSPIGVRDALRACVSSLCDVLLAVDPDRSQPFMLRYWIAGGVRQSDHCTVRRAASGGGGTLRALPRRLVSASDRQESHSDILRDPLRDTPNL